MDSECELRLCTIQRNDDIEDWALEVDLSGAFALSPGRSSISFTIDGERVTDEADMLLSVIIYSVHSDSQPHDQAQ